MIDDPLSPAALGLDDLEVGLSFGRLSKGDGQSSQLAQTALLGLLHRHARSLLDSDDTERGYEGSFQAQHTLVQKLLADGIRLWKLLGLRLRD